jgi:dUTP pyrophosphatase
MVYSRSGHGFKANTRLANCVGVIDCGYTGEVMVKLTMDDQFLENELDLLVKPGDRIAQAMLIPVPRVEFEVVEQLSFSERGVGGFGSTGQ